MLRSKIAQLSILAISITGSMMLAEKREIMAEPTIASAQKPMLGENGTGTDITQRNKRGVNGAGQWHQKQGSLGHEGENSSARLGANKNTWSPTPFVAPESTTGQQGLLGKDGHGQEQLRPGSRSSSWSPRNEPVGGGYAGGTVQHADGIMGN